MPLLHICNGDFWPLLCGDLRSSGSWELSLTFRSRGFVLRGWGLYVPKMPGVRLYG